MGSSRPMKNLILVKRLGDFPEVLSRALEEYEPSLIAVYMLELAMAFNVFLARHRVLGEIPKRPGRGFF